MPRTMASTNIPPGKTLMVARIIWLALMMGELMFLGITTFVILPNHVPAQPQPVLIWASIFMAVVVIPMTFLFRAAAFRRSAVNGAVPAGPFVTGNIIFWAGCEGVCFF